jgi:hypothetical protein
MCDLLYFDDHCAAGIIIWDILHLFSFKTPILLGKNIRKNVKSIVGISPTMVLLFHLPCF